MSKKLGTWIEGDGTIRTLFRKASLWDYATTERCKVQLVTAIEKKKTETTPYSIQYAVDTRKREVQIVSHYLPLFSLFLPFIAYVSLASMFKVIPHVYLGVGLVAAMIIIYKYTWFDQYKANLMVTTLLELAEGLGVHPKKMLDFDIDE